MNSAIFAAFAILFVAAVSGQSSLCANLTPKANLESSRLAGQWFGLHGLIQGVNVDRIKCLKENLQVNANGQINVAIEYIKTASNERFSRTAVGVPVDGQRSKLSFTNSAHPEASEEVVILDTDYDNYIIWVTCLTKDGQQGLIAAVLGRQQSLSAELKDQVKATLRANNLSDTLRTMDHTGC